MYIATVTLGRERTLQHPESEVSLNIPQGSEGVFVMGVHTDHAKFKNFLKEEECFVSPVVEVKRKNPTNESLPVNPTINIPHCLTDTNSLQYIRVKKGDSCLSRTFRELKKASQLNIKGAYYYVDKNFVRITTEEFSEFVCTSCRNTCQAKIRVFLFAALRAWKRNKVTTLKVKSFLCSHLFRIADYRNVSAQNIFQMLIPEDIRYLKYVCRPDFVNSIL